MRTSPEAADVAEVAPTPTPQPAVESEPEPTKRVRVKTGLRAGGMTPVRNLRG